MSFALLCFSLDRACTYPTRPLFRRDLCAGMMAEEARLLFQMLQQFGSKQVCDRRSTVCFAIPSEVCQMSAVLVCPLAAVCPAECRTPVVKCAVPSFASTDLRDDRRMRAAAFADAHADAAGCAIRFV